MTNYAPADGEITAAWLPDGEVRAHPTALFPETTIEQWREHSDLLDHAGRVVFSVGSYLIRSADTIALIDLGLGPTNVELPTGATYRGGELIGNLANAGVRPDDVDLVIYTHLHRDHVGWTTIATPTGRALTFGRARHVVHRAEWDYWLTTDASVGPDRATVVEPLRSVIELCEDGDELTRGVQVLATPGHTPGHISVILSGSANRQTVVTGDVLHSPVQLKHRDWCFGSDVSPHDAAVSREQVLTRFGADVLACGHFAGQPFTHL
jgi:glyoxylase-like metal-dependent hydrolase (beta-lactamase superfamily II)